jgi:hypothetical protein
LIEERLGLEDEEFWTDPWRTKKFVQRELMKKNEDTFLIGTPGKVGLDAHQSFPLAVIRVSRLGGRPKVDFGGSAIVTAIDLYTSELSAALAFDAPETASPAPAGDGGPPAMIGEGYIVDLAELLRIPAIRGDYLVTIICLDRVSNRSRMKLVETTGYEDPAVEQFFKEHLVSRRGPPRVVPEANSGPSYLPVYVERDDSPAIPSEVGIRMVVSRVNLISTTECILTGSYRLPVAGPHIVERSILPSNEPSRARRETCIVPITLLLTGSVHPSPKLLRLAVPSFRPLTTAGNETIATGYFTLDLCQMANLTTPQTYFIYAFAGPILAGPFPTAFVRIPPAAGWSKVERDT